MERSNRNLPENSSEEKSLNELRGKRLYSIHIPLLGIEANGFQDRTDTSDWILLGYVRHWMRNHKAKFVEIEGQRFYWLNYKHTIESLPILKIRTKQGLGIRIKKLKNNGLLETWPAPENSLYARLTDLALGCYDYVDLDNHNDTCKTGIERGYETTVEQPCETGVEQHNNLSSINKSPINQSSQKPDIFFDSVRGEVSKNNYQPKGKPNSQDSTHAGISSVREEKPLSPEALEFLARLCPKSMPKVANGYLDPEPLDPDTELAHIREMNRQRGFSK